MTPADQAIETPVPALDTTQERQLLNRLEANPPALVLVVSDLHLGKGTDRTTQRFFRRENFFADEAFRRFLRHYARPNAAAVLLVLNGDIFDFLRIDDWPERAADRARWIADLDRLGAPHASTAVSGHEKRFGLHTDPGKSVYKLAVIAQGHPVFFAALAEWIEAGGTILYTKGNHDVEQHWPLVRRALRDAIYRAGAAAGAVAARVAFAEDNATLANLYVEHGHNYERLTRVDGPAELPGGPERLNLPLGSFVNRYIINKMERVEPFLDNVKPEIDVLRAMVRRQPWTVFEISWRGVWLLLRALIERRVRHALLAGVIIAAALVYVVPLAIALAALLYFTWPGFHDWITRLPLLSSPAIRIAGTLGGALLPLIVGVVRGIVQRFRRPSAFEDSFAAGLYHRLNSLENGHARAWRQRYAVLGHTHAQDAQQLPPLAGAPILYLNSGTWIPLWPKDRPDLVGKVLHSYLRFERLNGEYVHQSLVWDDEIECPRPPQLLEAS